MKDTVKISFLGDFCPINRVGKLIAGNDFDAFTDIRNILREQDIVIANLECPLTLSEGKMEKMRRNAYISLTQMLDAAHKNKIDLFIHSAYRSYEVQCRVFSGKLVKQLSANGFISKQYTSPYALSEMNKDIKAGYQPEFTPDQLQQALIYAQT